MNYATIKDCDIANGPGVRVSLFVSGCTHHCKGCFNEVAWDFDYGTPFTVETEEKILAMLAPNYVKGIRAFSGYLFENMLAGKVGDIDTCMKFLKLLDVLVDGPFVESKKNLMLRFRGSENQRIIDVPASLEKNAVVLWEDWQGHGKEIR